MLQMSIIDLEKAGSATSLVELLKSFRLSSTLAGSIFYSVSSILITFTFHSNIKMAHTLNYIISVLHKFFHGFIFPKIHNSSPRDEWARWEKVGEASIAERSFPTKEKIFCFSSMCEKDPLSRDTHPVIINGAIGAFR